MSLIGLAPSNASYILENSHANLPDSRELVATPPLFTDFTVPNEVTLGRLLRGFHVRLTANEALANGVVETLGAGAAKWTTSSLVGGYNEGPDLDTTTGIYTCPDTASYLVSWWCQSNDTDPTTNMNITLVHVGGVTDGYTGRKFRGDDDKITLSGSLVMNLDAGDTLRLDALATVDAMSVVSTLSTRFVTIWTVNKL